MSLLKKSRRRVVQTVSLIALNTNLVAVLSLRRFCLPIMNCEACTFAWLGCPVGMMSRSIAFLQVPWLVIGGVLLVGAVMGRFLCGWVCPMGFLQDLLYKIRGPKFRLPAFTSWFKYAFLLVTVVGVAYFVQDYENSKLFFCRYCPTSAIQVMGPNLLGGGVALDSFFVLKVSVLALVVVLAIAHHRSFCKVMCPVGAMVALTNRFSLFSIRLKKDQCIECRKCDRSCPMDVPVSQSKEHGKPVNRKLECIGCLSCEESCPTGAIETRRRRFTSAG